MRALAVGVVGPEVWIGGLMNLIGVAGIQVPVEGSLSREYPAMTALCRALGWQVPGAFFLHPPNSPAVIIHWRSLLSVVGFLSGERAENVFGMFRDSPLADIAPPQRSTLGALT